jgi:uncharacterized protein
MTDMQLLSAGLGVLVGFVLALTGAGGAILAIPLLVYAMHLNVQQAAPIALLAIFVASSLGAAQGLHKGMVRYKTALLIAFFGLLLAPIGVKLSHYLPHHILNVMLAAILVFVALRIWQQSATTTQNNENLPPPACTINPATSKLFWTASCTKRLIFTGSTAGLLSGLLGVGGGFVIVPSLNKVSNFSTQTIVATTLAVVAIVSAGSLGMHMHSAQVQWAIAVPFTIGTTLAMLTLSSLRSHIPNQISQRGFALLCLFAAGYLTLKSL